MITMKSTLKTQVPIAVFTIVKPIGWPKAARNSCSSGNNPLAIDRAVVYTELNIATTPLNDALPRWLFYCPSSWRAK